MQTELSSHLSAWCLYRRMSASEGILHLLRWAEAKLPRRCDLDRLACGRITALTGRAVLDPKPAKAREVDLFALLRRIDDACEYRLKGLLGRALLHARFA